MKRVSYGVLGVIIAGLISMILFNGIPDLIKPDISKNIRYLDDMEIDTYVDLSDVITMIGYQVYPKDIQERLANNEFVYGRSNPMYFVKIKVEDVKDDTDSDGTSGDNTNQRSSGYYVYPHSGGEVFYKNESKPQKLGTYVNELNKEYSEVSGGFVKGYNKSSGDMDLVDIESLRNEFIEKGHLPLEKEHMAISSTFGVRVDPFDYSKGQTKDSRLLPFHTGLDLSNTNIEGSSVYNMMEGVVKDITISDVGYGNLVVVDNGRFETYYAHLQSIEEGLKVGDRLEAGEEIGKVGNTGRSTGPHLHIEMSFSGVAVNPEIFIPEEYIRKDVFQNIMTNPIREIPVKRNENGIIDFQFDELSKMTDSKTSVRTGGKILWM